MTNHGNIFYSSGEAEASTIFAASQIAGKIANYVRRMLSENLTFLPTV